MKRMNRLLSLLLLLSFCITAAAGCTKDPSTPSDTTNAPDATVDGVTTAVPEAKLTIDSTYRIVISAEADETVQKAADNVAAIIKEVTGLELSVVTDAESTADHEIILGHTNRANSTDDEGSYRVFQNGQSLHIDASDSATLYFAAEAVLKTWLTADFGLSETGVITLSESRVADLNGLTTALDSSIKIVTQNMRDADDPGGNTVPQRYERFLLFLEDCTPDIIGTQEHTYNWYLRFQKLFKKMKEGEAIPLYGLVGESVEGIGALGGGRNVIFYRTDRFDMLETGTFWLTDTPDVPSVLENSAHRRVCTWVLLKDKRTEKTILVANAHLDHTSESMRLRQATYMMDYLAEKVGDYPFFLTGDFNCSSSSSTYEMLTETLLDSRYHAWTDRSTVSCTYHGYSGGAWGSVIDHILYTERSIPVNFEIVSRDYGGYVSDHFGVMAEFVYN